MNRLTKRDVNGDAEILCENCPEYKSCNEGNGCVYVLTERLADYEDTGLTPEDLKSAFGADAIISLCAQALGVSADRLRELAAADRDGRVVVLPCKVGDTAYEIAKGLSIYQSGLHLYVYENTVTERKLFDWVLGNEFGKTVFLTRSEAEAALKEQEAQK